ncbi:DUF4256 domain-containing protein [Burkholderiaceae bacterium UC74_6]
MTPQEKKQLIDTLQARFEKHKARHKGVDWADVMKRLEGNAAALESLAAMEATGGEPDVIGRDAQSGVVTFCDCATESPEGRRSLCYDREALDARKEHKPQGNAMEMAASMGITLLDEDQYRALQALGKFDLKTSSWVVAPPEMRKLGGGLFCDRRFDRVFTYHNGVQSYYASRGFRGYLQV